jgi:plastocyanin
LSDPRIHGRLAVLAGGLLGVALALTGCGGASPSAAPPTPVASGVLAIEAKDYTFTPPAFSVPPGAVHFAVSNRGNENHEFEVLAGETSLGRIASFPRGTTQDLTLTLEPGTYTLVCRLNGHDQLGMKGTLTVTGS